MAMTNEEYKQAQITKAVESVMFQTRVGLALDRLAAASGLPVPCSFQWKTEYQDTEAVPMTVARDIFRRHLDRILDEAEASLYVK